MFLRLTRMGSCLIERCPRILAASTLTLLMQIGCGTTTPDPSARQTVDPTPKQKTDMSDKSPARPADFAVRYDWREGSVPPPYHYEYTVRIGPGAGGTIEFVPDYPMHDPPVWKDTFAVDAQALDSLYRLMTDKGVFRPTWTELADPPVGGSLEWMKVTAAGKVYGVPSQIEESDAVKDVYQAIRELVPKPIWEKLMSQQHEYARSHESRSESP